MCIFLFISRILQQILSQSYLAVSISWSFCLCLGDYTIRFSACSNVVSKSIQSITLFIIKWITLWIILFIITLFISFCRWYWLGQSSNFWNINQMTIGTFLQKIYCHFWKQIHILWAVQAMSFSCKILIFWICSKSFWHI